MNQGHLTLQHVEILVLDEADRMLDMGFINDVKKIIASVPKKRQTLFFSATMPDEIVKLSSNILHKPIKIEVTPVSSTADTIQQFIYFVDKGNKNKLLIEILKNKDIKTVLVFTRTKHGADKVVKVLHTNNIKAEAIHGNIMKFLTYQKLMYIELEEPAEQELKERHIRFVMQKKNLF